MNETQTIKIWRETYRLLKIGAATLGVSMSYACDEALRNYLKKEGLADGILSSVPDLRGQRRDVGDREGG